MIFQKLSTIKNSLSHETVSLAILAIKIKFLCNFGKTLNGGHFMGHISTGLKFSIITDF